MASRPSHRDVKRTVADARDLTLGVRLRIPDAALASDGVRSPLAEVDATGKFADDDQIRSLDDLWAEGGESDDFGINDDRPEVHEKIEGTAQAEDRRRFDAAPLRMMHLRGRSSERPLEDCVG